MFKNTGTLSSNLWLKRGSRYACMHLLICVSMFICFKHESMIIVSRSRTTDNVPGDVETSMYTPEYSKYLFFSEVLPNRLRLNVCI